jgi:hypothetical protein
MFVRFLVFTYFPSFFVGVGLAKLSGLDALRGLPLGVAAVLLIFVVARSAILRRHASRMLLQAAAPVVLYAIVYSVLYFPRAFHGWNVVGLLPSLMLHVFFWMAAYRAPIYTRRRDLFFRDLWGGATAGFVTGLVGAMAGASWSLTPGALHNLSETAAFVRSDLDVPLLGVVVGLVGAEGLVHGRSQSRSTGRLWSLFRFTIAFVGLVLYARRVPLAALFLGIASLIIARQRVAKVLYVVFLIPLAPFVWDTMATVLLAVTQNPIVDSILARNDAASYLTASNRVETWLKTVDFLRDVRVQHLWGYGGPPEYVLPRGLGWQHVHSGVLEVVLEAGFISLALALVVAARAIGHVLVVSRDQRFFRDATLIVAVMVAWFAEAALEPALRGYSIVHLLFLLGATLSACMFSDVQQEANVGAAAPRPQLQAFPTGLPADSDSWPTRS